MIIYHFLHITVIIRHQHYQHHQGALTARISLTISHHSPQLIIAISECSGQHPESAHSWWMKVFAGQLTLVCPHVGVQKRTSHMGLLILVFQPCPILLGWLVWWERSGRTLAIFCFVWGVSAFVLNGAQHHCAVSIKPFLSHTKNKAKNK